MQYNTIQRNQTKRKATQRKATQRYTTQCNAMQCNARTCMHELNLKQKLGCLAYKSNDNKCNLHFLIFSAIVYEYFFFYRTLGRAKMRFAKNLWA